MPNSSGESYHPMAPAEFQLRGLENLPRLMVMVVMFLLTMLTIGTAVLFHDDFHGFWRNDDDFESRRD